MTIINSFRNEFGFLSNFSSAVIVYEGITYPTTEHAFQAAKTLDIEERKRIASLSTPAAAKAAGRTVKLRKDWNSVRLSVMKDMIAQKFAPGSINAQRLLSTGDATLIEGNTWGDVFWGVCNGRGENHLGKTLMAQRNSLSSTLGEALTHISTGNASERKVLVCGGRDYSDKVTVFQVLDALHKASPISQIIHGAARGADSLADEWAKKNNVAILAKPADWNQYGKAAGFIRNRSMLVEGKPTEVVAFPGGAGTANMVDLATRAKVSVTIIAPAVKEDNKNAITYINGDLLACDSKVIAHCANCFGVMGAGVALAIKLKYPKAYMADLSTKKGDRAKLGTFSKSVGTPIIYNLYGQYNYGYFGGKPSIDYNALERAMIAMAADLKANKHEGVIALPRLGAGLAGGDWKIIEALIVKHLCPYWTVRVYSI